MRAGITEAIQATFPNETVAIDILGPFPKSEAGNIWVLTMIDTFTRWPVATPIKDKSSASIATAIYNNWICEKSVPLKVISDRAREFISKGMKQLAHQMGTVLITTSGYNPTGNSSVERFHRYLNSALSIVYEKIRANWDEYIPSILFSYRASVNDTTGHTPFFLEHGREPQLPLGNLFPYLRKEEVRENFVQEITGRLDFAFGRARELQAITAEKNKARKPEQFQPKFKPGDFLLLKARAANESRLEEKDENDRHVSIPEKLRNQFVGPYRMVRWVGEILHHRYGWQGGHA
jgi:transposase InsO family protein